MTADLKPWRTPASNGWGLGMAIYGGVLNSRRGRLG